MLQCDYEAILRDTVLPNIPTGQRGKVLLEDNHTSHGHALQSPLRKIKDEMGLRWEAAIPTSPDLNVQEKIWRVLKQRVKARGVPNTLQTLKGWIQEAWDSIEQSLINRYIDEQVHRIRDIHLRGGGLTPL